MCFPLATFCMFLAVFPNYSTKCCILQWHGRWEKLKSVGASTGWCKPASEVHHINRFTLFRRTCRNQFSSRWQYSSHFALKLLEMLLNPKHWSFVCAQRLPVCKFLTTLFWNSNHFVNYGGIFIQKQLSCFGTLRRAIFILRIVQQASFLPRPCFENVLP